MGITKREIASELGVSKRTVANYIEKLGLGNHVSRNGNTDFLDDFAAAAIAGASWETRRTAASSLNQFMKFLNTYGIKVFDAGEAQRVLAREVETFVEVAEALAALRREAERNNICLQIEDFDNAEND